MATGFKQHFMWGISLSVIMAIFIIPWTILSLIILLQFLSGNLLPDIDLSWSIIEWPKGKVISMGLMSLLSIYVGCLAIINQNITPLMVIMIWWPLIPYWAYLLQKLGLGIFFGILPSGFHRLSILHSVPFWTLFGFLPYNFLLKPLDLVLKTNVMFNGAKLSLAIGCLSHIYLDTIGSYVGLGTTKPKYHSNNYNYNNLKVINLFNNAIWLTLVLAISYIFLSENHHILIESVKSFSNYIGTIKHLFIRT